MNIDPSLVVSSLCSVLLVSFVAYTFRSNRKIQIAAVLVTIAVVFLLHLIFQRNELSNSPTSVYKRIDSPFPLNQWDHHILINTLTLPMMPNVQARTLWWPHDMTTGDVEYRLLTPALRNQIWTAILPGSDTLVCKTRLAMYAKTMSPKVQSYLPTSFTRYDLKSPSLQTEIHQSGTKLYIAKSNQQRQQSVMIYQNGLPSEEELSPETAIVQEILSHPLLVNSHKSTFRVYLLTWIRKQNETEMWIYDDGFMYYAMKPYKECSPDLDVHVASGYNERALYNDRPLTHEEYFQFEDEKRRKTRGWTQKKIHGLFIKSLGAVTREFVRPENNLIDRDAKGSFQLFGVDVQVNHDLTSVHILEYNKCPNLEPMDVDRDRRVKEQMSQSMWAILLPRLGFEVRLPKNTGWIAI